MIDVASWHRNLEVVGSQEDGSSISADVRPSRAEKGWALGQGWSGHPEAEADAHRGQDGGRGAAVVAGLRQEGGAARGGHAGGSEGWRVNAGKVGGAHGVGVGGREVGCQAAQAQAGRVAQG